MTELVLPTYLTLGCEVHTLSYDFRTKVGSLDIQGGKSCEMQAAIALFELVDPEVRLIQIYAGERTDERFRLTPTGGWVAEVPRGVQ
jgi:hypothetical protein